MPTCPRCGKVNINNAQFCQECGNRLAPAAAPAPAPVASDRPVCADCGTANDPGMRFCKMCGKPLARPTQPVAVVEKPAPAVEVKAPAPAAAPATLACPSCHQQTPSGLPFCQQCGTKLTAPAAAPVVAPVPTPASVRPAKQDLKPAVTARPEAATLRAEPPKAEAVPAAARDAAVTMRGLVTNSGRQVITPLTAAAGPKSEPRLPAPWGRLVFVRDGADAESQPLTGDNFDIGRTDGQLVIGADPYLASRHARLATSGGAVKLRALDATNGVYVKLREGHELAPGDLLLVGRQLLRFEVLSPEERDAPALVELGVRLAGSHVRETWGRLRQITAAGTTRDVYHLTRNEVVLGRAEGDIHFPDDEHVAPRHAVLRRSGARARLEDLGSHAGTFVRLRGDRELKSGDVIRLGDQTLRFETL